MSSNKKSTKELLLNIFTEHGKKNKKSSNNSSESSDMPITTYISKNQDNNNKSKHSNTHIKNNNLILTDITETYTLTFTADVYLDVEMSGAGGAGGIGCSQGNYHLYGGGGGAGYNICFKIKVCKNDKWKINIGKGGISKYDLNGGNTTIQRCNNDTIVADGGTNGRPYYSDYVQIKNGSLDLNTLTITQLNELVSGGILNGENGAVGTISRTGCAGNGGTNECSGLKGAKGNIKKPNGSCGHLGSGGGGSVYFVDVCNKRLSGDGGNGYVNITLLNSSLNLCDVIIC